MRRVRCLICGEEKYESRSGNDYSNTCWECKQKEKDRKRMEWVESRKSMSLAERIQDIEEGWYNG